MSKYPLICSGLRSPQKKRRRWPALLPSTSMLLATVDVDVAHITARVDVASKRQVRRGIVPIAESAVSADTIWAVAVVGVPAAARETSDPHTAVTGAPLLSNAQDPAGRR